MTDGQEIEVKGFEIQIKMNYKNSKGLIRQAGLGFEFTPEVLEPLLANKAKFNKFMGDHIMDAYTACEDLAKEEYSPRGKFARQEVVEDLWKEQEKKAKKATPPNPDATDRSISSVMSKTDTPDNFDPLTGSAADS